MSLVDCDLREELRRCKRRFDETTTHQRQRAGVAHDSSYRITISTITTTVATDRATNQTRARYFAWNDDIVATTLRQHSETDKCNTYHHTHIRAHMRRRTSSTSPPSGESTTEQQHVASPPPLPSSTHNNSRPPTQQQQQQQRKPRASAAVALQPLHLPPPAAALRSVVAPPPLRTMHNNKPLSPVPLPPYSSGNNRKRKTSHSKKPSSNNNNNNNNSDNTPVQAPLPPPTSPFEKLNTLKLLLDCGHLTHDEYHERKTQIINDMTGTSTLSSNSNSNSSGHKKKPSPRRVVLQPILKTVVPHAPPEFGRIPKERAEKLSFDVETLEWHAAPTRVKLDLVPFATGQLRNAYYLQELGDPTTTLSDASNPQLLVAKFSIRHAAPSSYLSDVEMQAVCAHYAELYNEHEPPLRVDYAQSWLLKLRDRHDLVCSIEQFLPGAYVKYSNNSGYVGTETSSTEERERNTPQAFSHFTFVASDYRLMVVDIQGVADSYTDPQIHTADGRGFGAGNLGTFGMEKFLASHRCNDVCRWLGLRSINERSKNGGTAAPAYAMPFGGAGIKKSTNRITEERNTFSTSVTVSEAFGTAASSSLIEDASGDGDDALHANQHPFASVLGIGIGGGGGGGSSGYGSMRVEGGRSGLKHQVGGKSQRSMRREGNGSDSGSGTAAAASCWWWLVLKRLVCCCYTV